MILLMNLNTMLLILAFLVEPIWAKILFCAGQAVCLWFTLDRWDELNERVDDLELSVVILAKEKLKTEVFRDGH